MSSSAVSMPSSASFSASSAAIMLALCMHGVPRAHVCKRCVPNRVETLEFPDGPRSYDVCCDKCTAAVHRMSGATRSVVLTNADANDETVASEIPIGCAVIKCPHRACCNACYFRHIQRDHAGFRSVVCAVCCCKFAYDGRMSTHAKCCSAECKSQRLFAFEELHPADAHFAEVTVMIELVKLVIASKRLGQLPMWKAYLVNLVEMMPVPGRPLNAMSYMISKRALGLFSTSKFRDDIATISPQSPRYISHNNNRQEYDYKVNAQLVAEAAFHIGRLRGKAYRFRRIYSNQFSEQVIEALERKADAVQEAIDSSMICPHPLLDILMIERDSIQRNNKAVKALTSELATIVQYIDVNNDGPRSAADLIDRAMVESEATLQTIDVMCRNPLWMLAASQHQPMWIQSADPLWKPTQETCVVCGTVFDVTKAHVFDDWNYSVGGNHVAPCMTICLVDTCANKTTSLCYNIECQREHASTHVDIVAAIEALVV